MSMDSKKATSSVLLAISVVTAIHLLFIAKNIWPINGDEAQYFGWSQELDLGYYSKPPMLAWLIALTTKVFGGGVVGLRLASPLCHAITAWVIFLIATRIINKNVGFWSSVTYLMLPGVSFSSSIISTDPPLMMFWAWGFYFLVRALQTDLIIDWILCGIAIGFSLLSKYTAIFFLVSLFLYLIFTPEMRPLLKKKNPYLTVLFALLAITPNLFWNMQHYFVSFIAVKNNANLHFTSLTLHWENLFIFLGAQLAIFGPILFSVLLIGSVDSLNYHKKNITPWMSLLLFFSVPLLLLMSLEGLFSKANGNWAAPGYITGCIAVIAFLLQKKQGRNLLYLTLVLNLLVLFGLFYAQPIVRAFGIHMPISMTTTNWQTAGKKIAEIKRRHSNTSLLVDNRMLMALAMYYSNTSLKETYKWNPLHLRNDHYDLVTDMRNKHGHDFILVSYRPAPQDILQHFSESHLLDTIHLETLDGQGSFLYVFHVIHFMG
ncbi:MAG: hypothetical protein A3E83_08260 [Gammaproteobacteria bacterium RIFCSPHIGHO2_12_FULL_41_20]|nr:MAG: hypothetical protein A3E83_08260 [Gammaproteobacteria bacterium RIFCSPHIGHO2_12_FULL_41_20]